LSLIARRPKSAQAMAMRARIVLSCGQGMSNSDGTKQLQVTGATVGKWRERFREFGQHTATGAGRSGIAACRCPVRTLLSRKCPSTGE